MPLIHEVLSDGRIHGHANPPETMRDNKTFKRGMRFHPRVRIEAAARGRLPDFKPRRAATPSFGVVPPQLSMWLNDQDGDCVTAAQMAWIAAMTYLVLGAGKEVVISDAAVLAFANQFNVLNGADPVSVIQDMQQTGVTDGGNTYKDGPTNFSVDYTNDATEQAAIAECCGAWFSLDASALPAGAGNGNGWYMFGGTPGQFSNIDHEMLFLGFGTAAQCFAFLNIPLPAGVDGTTPNCYLAFTWSSVGVMDSKAKMSCVADSNCCTSLLVNGTPLVVPGPGPSPTPPPPGPGPGPAPTPGNLLAPGDYTLQGAYSFTTATGVDPALLARLQADVAALSGAGDGAIPWQTVIQIVTALVKLFGPLVEPFLIQWVASLPLSDAQKAYIDALIQQLLGERKR